jgi:hypothetical protein
MKSPPMAVSIKGGFQVSEYGRNSYLSAAQKIIKEFIAQRKLHRI